MARRRAELAQVVSLDEHRPHLSGKARCLGCGHEWVAVSPVGTTWMECPKCRCELGRFVAQVEREGLHWHCQCGNELFYVTEDGCYCPVCGLFHEGL